MALSINNGGIYEIRNLINGKRYIGSTKGFLNRWAVHRHQLRKGTHHNPHLQNSWNKYGEAAFGFFILETCSPEDCIEREQAYFAELHPEYNVAPVSGSPLGYKHTESAKENMHQAQLQRAPHSSETRRKISESLKGHCVSNESRTKMRAAHLGKPSPRKGKKASSETLRRMSEARTGISIRGHKVLNSTTGKEYKSVAEAARAIGMKRTALDAQLRGINKNRSGLVFVC